MSTQAPEPAAVQPPAPRRSPLGAAAATAGVVLLKGKALLGALKLASLGKFALTGLSMLAMVWFEAQRSGIWFAVGFVLLILVHELGHGVAIKRAGLEAGWPVFIPFFGAMISLRGRPQSRDVEANIAYAGPLAGTAASLVVAGIGLLTGTRLFLALAYTGFFLNLFNMVPMPPLDGGRVATVFSPRAWILGAVVLGGMFLVTGAPQLALIGLLALSHMRRRNAAPALAGQAPALAGQAPALAGQAPALPGQGPDAPEVEPVPEDVRTRWTVRYFGLCFFLGAAIFFTQRLLGR